MIYNSPTLSNSYTLFVAPKLTLRYHLLHYKSFRLTKRQTDTSNFPPFNNTSEPVVQQQAAATTLLHHTTHTQRPSNSHLGDWNIFLQIRDRFSYVAFGGSSVTADNMGSDAPMCMACVPPSPHHTLLCNEHTSNGEQRHVEW